MTASAAAAVSDERRKQLLHGNFYINVLPAGAAEGRVSRPAAGVSSAAATAATSVVITNSKVPAAAATSGGMRRQQQPVQLRPAVAAAASKGAGPSAPTVPAIPRSQAVKQLMEPSYSTILQPDPQLLPPPPPPPPPPSSLQHQQPPPPFSSSSLHQQIYSNAMVGMGGGSSVYSYYSELEALRSSDSQGSAEGDEVAALNVAAGGGGLEGLGGGPPSPVSSSYSELRQAIPRRMPPFNGDGNIPETAAAEAAASAPVYEPVTPGVRAKTVSVGANLASPYAVSAGIVGSNAAADRLPALMRLPPRRDGAVGGAIGGATSAVALRGQKGGVLGEEDIGDGSATSGSDDFFGLCTKCNMNIIGDGGGRGCTAMGRLYHVECFTCTNCFCLLQGKPFYALDGKPFCEECYLQTLEKCCKCLTPILDRILRATGKPYHPQCFTCVMCNKSLDGVPFTVDATNQIHCIEDFHRRFAPRCSVCKEPIMPDSGNEETVRVVALDRSFHVHCYRCEDCSLLLSSEAEGRGCYPLDDHVLCKQCNTRRIQLLTQGIK